MRFILSVVVCSILLFNCSEKGDSPATGLRVSEPDHLYFKNVRVNLYASIDDDELHLTRYVHRKFTDNESPVRLVLIDNWLHGRAYLEAETSEGVENATVFRIGLPGQSGVVFDAEDLEDRKSLRVLKNELSGNAEVCYPGNTNMDNYCFPVGSPVREALRVTILDFLKLTTLEDGRSPG